MHWILIGIGLIILRLTEPMFGMFLSEISWFVFSGLFIYLGFALNNLQTSIRGLQVRQRELLLELKRVSKTSLRAMQSVDYSLAQDARQQENAFWIEDQDEPEFSSNEITQALNDEEWQAWLTENSEYVPSIFKDTPPEPHPPTST